MTETMTEHPNATIVRNMWAAMESGDMQGASDALADDIVWHEIGNPEPRRGKAELAAAMTGGDYEIKATTHDVVANDEHVIALTNAVATRGGRTLEYKTAEIMHVKDGKITERWAFSDDTAAITAFFA